MNAIITVAPLQSPWLPELYALFDDAQKIAPPLAAQWIRYGVQAEPHSRV